MDEYTTNLELLAAGARWVVKALGAVAAALVAVAMLALAVAAVGSAASKGGRE